MRTDTHTQTKYRNLAAHACRRLIATTGDLGRLVLGTYTECSPVCSVVIIYVSVFCLFVLFIAVSVFICLYLSLMGCIYELLNLISGRDDCAGIEVVREQKRFGMK